MSGWVAASGLWRVLGSPAQPWHRSPLLALGLLEPPGEIIDAHVLKLEQMFQTLHLHLKDLDGNAETSSLKTCCLASVLPLQASSCPLGISVPSSPTCTVS